MIEFLTILSGISLFSLVFVPDPDRNARNTAVFAIGGLGIFGYGVAMAMADSGTWFYSWFVLAIPLFAGFQWYSVLLDRDTPSAPAGGLPPSLQSGPAAPPAAPTWTEPVAHPESPAPPEDGSFAPWDPTAPKA